MFSADHLGASASGRTSLRDLCAGRLADPTEEARIKP